MDTELTIGEVARRAGVSPSAIRYYESVGLVEPERRSGGRRLYGELAVERLALISFAKGAGFTLDEVRQLIDGFPKETPVGARWTELATAKLVELEAESQRIEVMRGALNRIMRCRCVEVDQCAHGIATSRCR
ncbi:MAG TPA: MerR family transcriptional regulator [Thermoanaerobaculia bacterium]|jgi:MerR family redox-sensitive transcriptional activator SoxR|nr:MerR family transcriptional regulator [Thermoanaerobaculia bacterium]